MLLYFRFSDDFLGFWPKRVSEHSQTQSYQVYWVKTAQRVFSVTQVGKMT